MNDRRPLALLVALLAVHSAYIVTNYEHGMAADELYYVGKARYIAEHGRVARADSPAIAAEKGEAWGTSDWRPQGYPLLVAIVSLGDFTDPAGTLRLRMTVLQFLLIAAVLTTLFLLAMRSGVRGRSRYAAAFILGAPPWTFATVNDFGPDAVNVFFVGVSLLLLWRYIREGTTRRMMLATLVATTTLFLRPEMIALSPLMVVGALVLRWRVARPRLRDPFAAAMVWLALVGVQAGYHTWATGQKGIFGGLHIVNAGTFEWANNWWGTEKEAYDFVYAITEARPVSLPDRAFDSAAERVEVLAVVDRVQKHGRFTAADDAVFARLAERKKRNHPIRSVALRGWHAVNMWLNLENNSPLLGSLSPVPRALRRPFYGALVVLRVFVLALAASALLHTARKRQLDIYDLLILLMFGYAFVRTTFIGVVLNWNVSRYMLSAWPPVLWVACMALRTWNAAHLEESTR